MARPKTKTKAQSTNEYAARNYDAIRLNVKKGAKEVIKNHAEKQGGTIQGYIKKLIGDDIPGIDI